MPLSRFWSSLLRLRKMMKKMPIAASRHTPPATPTPIPTLVPVVSAGAGVDVALVLVRDVLLVFEGVLV